MPATYCCPNCFGDRFLERSIFPTLDSREGRCDYCEEDSSYLVNPIQLRDQFEPLVGAYEEDASSSETIVEWLKKDWLLFDHPNMSAAQAQRLLAEVLDDGDIVRRGFRPSDNTGIVGLANWDTLKEELRYKNRYFLDEELDAVRLGGLLSQLLSDPLEPIWYRARMMTSEQPYDLESMGAPPKHLASHGRANPSGIPYLYLASNPETGISEIRPHTGEKACVAKFAIPEDIVVVDLRQPRKIVSPFLLQDTIEILRLRSDIPFLEKLSEELTRPVLPRSAAIDYVPSQYLCEFIKKNNFSGVLYRSSVGSGMNLALFDTNLPEPRAIEVYSVDQVTVAVSGSAS